MKEAVIIGTIAREKGTDGDPSAVGAKWRVAGGGGNGTGLERANGWCRQKKKHRPYLFFLPGFGLGPGSDISHTSSSRGEKDFLL